jgi:hypothetical protein
VPVHRDAGTTFDSRSADSRSRLRGVEHADLCLSNSKVSGTILRGCQKRIGRTQFLLFILDGPTSWPSWSDRFRLLKSLAKEITETHPLFSRFNFSKLDHQLL